MQEPKDIVISLAALAHRYRLSIFRLLADHNASGMAASDIAQKIGASLTNTSFHLKELTRAGLLRPTREGRSIRYAIDTQEFRKLLTYLKQVGATPSRRGVRVATKSGRR